MNELRTQLERRYLMESVQRNEIMRNMQVTDEEARQYYKAHPELFKKPATIMLRELFVEVPTSTQGRPDGVQRGRKPTTPRPRSRRRGPARSRARTSPRSSAEVSDAGSKANGGLIGPVVINELSEALAKAISGLKPGQFSEITRTARGYMFFKLESRSEEALEPFDMVKDDVIQRIAESRLDNETKKHIEKLRAQALIEWKDEQLPSDLREGRQGDARQVKVGSLTLTHPVALAPMAGMTDTAFRRLVKRRGGCGLVVSEMVSSEGLVRGIDRTLEYAEYTEEERPVSIQIFGGDPDVMADAAQVVEGMGADIVDINMGCPVPKIAKHHAGCSLMRDPAHAASVVAAMAKAVKIPVTVKMRAGWNDQQINAPQLARLVQDAGAAAVAVHGRTAAQSYTGESDWSLIGRIARDLDIPGVRFGRLRRAGPGRLAPSGNRGGRRPDWAAARCGTRGSSARRPRPSPAARRSPCRSRRAGDFSSSTSICFLMKARMRRPTSVTPRPGPPPPVLPLTAAGSAGSSTSSARWVPGTRRGSMAAPSFEFASTPRSQ